MQIEIKHLENAGVGKIGDVNDPVPVSGRFISLSHSPPVSIRKLAGKFIQIWGCNIDPSIVATGTGIVVS